MWLTVKDAEEMGMIPTSGVGEMGKSFFKRMRKLSPGHFIEKIHRKVNPIHKLIRPPAKKRQAVAYQADGGESGIPSGELNQPSTVSPVDQVVAQSSPTPKPIVMARNVEPDEPVETRTSEPAEGQDLDTRIVSNEEGVLPNDVQDNIDDAEDQMTKFIEDQTNHQINETDDESVHEDTIDGVGAIIATAPSGEQQWILPKSRQADLFDKGTNPHLYKRRAGWRGKPIVQGRQASNSHVKQRKVVRMGNSSGVSGPGFLPETLESRVKVGVLGFASIALSEFLPGKYAKMAKLGGILALVIDGLSLFSEKKNNSGAIEPGQKPNVTTKGDPSAIDGSVVTPGNGATVQIGYDFQIPVQFRLENHSDQTVTASYEYRIRYMMADGVTKSDYVSYWFSPDVEPQRIKVLDLRFTIKDSSKIWKFASGTLYVNGRRLDGGAYTLSYP